MRIDYVRAKAIAEAEMHFFDQCPAEDRKNEWGNDYYAAEELKKKRKEMNAKQQR